MSHRIERVNTLIRRELSELIQRQLRDPRITGFLSVTAVETSPDLKYAKIYVSGMDVEGDTKVVADVLNAAAGFLRTELATKIRLRRMPELSFFWDSSIERGDRILRLIDEVNKGSTEYDEGETEA